jgi:hypothetical protein
MDFTTVLIMFVAGLAALGLTLYMLNRAWGDFPRRPDRPGPPPSPASTRLAPPSPADPDPAASGPGDADDAPLPAGAPAADLIPITSPTVRQAVERAMERGGSPYATYFIRHGDQIYLAAHRIADPMQRAQVVRVFRGLNGDNLSGVALAEAISALQRLGK